ncbi:MAG TPA: hypothetical protein VJN70_20435 [Gemmatimonadaceae bacterium]|nr:hypothetical protein [Gemmatimonadaceae bacterium]
MRKQYFFRASPQGLLAWDVDRLVLNARDLPVQSMPLSEIRELDCPVSGDDETTTWRALVTHLVLIDAADLGYPIILAADGSVMDGRHRLAKALREGRSTIDAVQFAEDPPPDYVGKQPHELPY